MGAAKIPEQVAERFEMGLRALIEDQARDPIIERLKAMPVIRVIKPEEKSRRRTLSEASIKNTEAITKRFINESRLKALLQAIAKLNSKRPIKRTKADEDELALLTQSATRVRAMLPVKIAKRKQTKAKPVKRTKRRVIARPSR